MVTRFRDFRGEPRHLETIIAIPAPPVSLGGAVGAQSGGSVVSRKSRGSVNNGSGPDPRRFGAHGPNGFFEVSTAGESTLRHVLADRTGQSLARRARGRLAEAASGPRSCAKRIISRGTARSSRTSSSPRETLKTSAILASPRVLGLLCKTDAFKSSRKKQLFTQPSQSSPASGPMNCGRVISRLFARSRRSEPGPGRLHGQLAMERAMIACRDPRKQPIDAARGVLQLHVGSGGPLQGDPSMRTVCLARGRARAHRLDRDVMGRPGGRTCPGFLGILRRGYLRKKSLKPSGNRTTDGPRVPWRYHRRRHARGQPLPLTPSRPRPPSRFACLTGPPSSG